MQGEIANEILYTTAQADRYRRVGAEVPPTRICIKARMLHGLHITIQTLQKGRDRERDTCS